MVRRFTGNSSICILEKQIRIILSRQYSWSLFCFSSFYIVSVQKTNYKNINYFLIHNDSFNFTFQKYFIGSLTIIKWKSFKNTEYTPQINNIWEPIRFSDVLLNFFIVLLLNDLKNESLLCNYGIQRRHYEWNENGILFFLHFPYILH